MGGLGLVSYASSDEEDEPSHKNVPAQPPLNVAAKGPSPAPAGNDATNKINPATSRSNEEIAGSTVEDSSMIGPAMPKQLHDTDDFTQDQGSPGSPQQISEREAIHFLTQATYPMTSIPPSPPGSPNAALNTKFKRFLELKSKGVHFNEDLASKSAFQNPGLLASMMTRAGLEGDDQYKTSVPLEVFDPTGFPPSAYKEELLRSQQSLKEQEQAMKKSLSATGKRAIEFTSGEMSAASSRESTPGMPTKRKRPR
jgi:hypothetical protein